MLVEPLINTFNPRKTLYVVLTSATFLYCVFYFILAINTWHLTTFTFSSCKVTIILHAQKSNLISIKNLWLNVTYKTKYENISDAKMTYMDFLMLNNKAVKYYYYFNLCYKIIIKLI